MDLAKTVAKKYMLVRRFRGISSKIKISDIIGAYKPSGKSKNYVLWGLIRQDPSMEDFCQLNFPSFSMKRTAI